MALTFSLTPQDDTWNQTVGEAELGAPITEDVEVTALEGNDTVTGTAFNDLLLGNQGNDSLNSGIGDDIVYGGQGNDFVTSPSGNNLLLGNFGNDTIIGGTGNDTIFGGRDNDSIVGTAGNNEIYGNFGDDIIIAGTGNDFIHGGQGNDTIVGSAGTDTLIGGKDNDTFVLSSAGVAGNGDSFDGGEGDDNLLVEANNDITGAQITSIETVTIAQGVTLTASLNNLTAVTALRGQGIIQITATNADIKTYIDSLGANVDATLRVLDQNGNPVVGTPAENPTDPDKEQTSAGTFTLGADNIVFSGRANAPLNTAAGIFNNVTLQSADIAQGTGTNDVLTVEVGSNTKDTIIPVINPQLTGIETLNFSTTFIGPVPQFNGSRTTETKTVVFSDSTAGLNVQNLRNVVDLVLRNHFVPADGNNDTIANFNPDVTDPAVNIALENSRSPNTALIVDGGFETFNVTSTKVNEFDANVNNQLGAILSDPFGAATSLRTVNVLGDQNLRLFKDSDSLGGVSSLPDEVVRIDAGGLLNTDGTPVLDADGNPVRPTFTANLSIDKVPVNNLTVIGGNGDDRFGFDATLNEKDNINGGEGEDSVLALFQDGVNEPLSTLRMNNVETLTLNILSGPVPPGNGFTTVPMNDVFGLNTIIFNQVVDNTAIAQITGITVVPDAEFQGNKTPGVQSPHGVSMNGTSGPDTFNLSYGNSGIGTSYNAGGIRTELIEALNIEVNDGSIAFNASIPLPAVIPPVPTPNISGDGNLKTITITGNRDVTAGAIESNTNGVNATVGKGLTGIDASAVEGKFTASSSTLADGAVVTVGKGTSNFNASLNLNTAGKGITINGQGGDDLLASGNGNDLLVGGGGGDRLTGGLGNDTFGYTQLSDSLFASRDVITDFTPGVVGAIVDKIRVPSNIRLDLGISNVAPIPLPNVTNVENAFKALLANQIGVFNDGVASTFVVLNNGVAGYQAGSDSLIQIDSGVFPALDITNFVLG